MRLSLLASPLILLLSSTLAFPWGPCSSCEDIITRQPENLQTEAREVQRILEIKNSTDLGILIAAGNEICNLTDCQNLSPEFVSKLAARIEESRFRNQTETRLDRQDWFSAVNMIIGLLALLLSFIALRKKRAR